MLAVEHLRPFEDRHLDPIHGVRYAISCRRSGGGLVRDCLEVQCLRNFNQFYKLGDMSMTKITHLFSANLAC